jgi:hypothetical protein
MDTVLALLFLRLHVQGTVHLGHVLLEDYHGKCMACLSPFHHEMGQCMGERGWPTQTVCELGPPTALLFVKG